MTEQTTYTNEHDEFFDERPNTAVVDNLCGVDGELIGRELLRNIFDSDWERIVVIGEPGSGKTTIVNQLAWGLHDFYGKKVGIRSKFYDNALSKFESQIAKKDPLKRYRENWTAEDWMAFERYFFDDIENFDALPKFDRTIQLVELPGVGTHPVKTRARETAKMLSLESQKRSLFVYSIPDPENQRFASELRSDIASLPSENVIDYLESKNIHLVGVENNKKNGRKIKNHTRMMATFEHISVIQREVFSAAVEWSRWGSPNQRVELVEIDLDVDPTVKLKALYAQAYLKDYLKVDDDDSLVVFNKHDSNRIIYLYPALGT